MTVLGDAVKAKLKRQKIDLRQASKLVGVSHSTMSRVTRNYEPDFHTFARLCKWLDLSPEFFLDENGLKP